MIVFKPAFEPTFKPRFKPTFNSLNFKGFLAKKLYSRKAITITSYSFSPRITFFHDAPMLIQKHRNFATSQQCGDTALELLKCGIKHYADNDTVDAYKCLTRAVRDEQAEEGIKAAAHLYIAKTQLLGSSKAEWYAIINLEKARDIFSRVTSESYDKYKSEMQNEFKKIDAVYGSFEKYKESLEKYLKELGIFPKVSTLPTLRP